MRKFLSLLVLFACAFLLGRASDGKSRPLKIVAELDLSRYAGTWYEIARLPNYFQRKCTGDVSATYSLRDDGSIDVFNQCASGESTKSVLGVGRAKDPDSKAGHLKVTFAPAILRGLPFVWADYCVIDVDANYRYALVGEPSRRYLWILSRDKNVPEAQYDRLVALAKEQGFDTDKLIRAK